MKNEPEHAERIREHFNKFTQPMVKTRHDKGAPHLGQARLIALLGNGKARIRPLHGHKHDEIVSVDDLLPWQSASIQNENLATLPKEKLVLHEGDFEELTSSLPAMETGPRYNGDPTKEWLGKNHEYIEISLHGILDNQPPDSSQRIRKGTIRAFLEKQVLNNTRQFKLFHGQMNTAAGFTLNEKKLRRFLKNTVRRFGDKPLSFMISDIEPVQVADAPQPTESAKTETPSAPPVVETAIDGDADAHPVEPEVAPPAAATVCEVAPVETLEAPSREIYIAAMRRVVRDHEKLDSSEKYDLEAAIVGTSRLNERLDALGVDDAVAEVLQLQGYDADGDAVRSFREETWPTTPQPMSPGETLNQHLADGSLTVEEVINALMKSTNVGHPTALMRFIAGLGLETRPVLEPLESC